MFDDDWGFAWFILFVIVGVVGWALIEFVLWLFSFITISVDW